MKVREAYYLEAQWAVTAIIGLLPQDLGDHKGDTPWAQDGDIFWAGYGFPPEWATRLIDVPGAVREPTNNKWNERANYWRDRLRGHVRQLMEHIPHDTRHPKWREAATDRVGIALWVLTMYAAERGNWA